MADCDPQERFHRCRCPATALGLIALVGCGDRMILSGYGSTLGASPLTKEGEHRLRLGPHAGVDIRADVGDEVIAASDGIVVSLSEDEAVGKRIVSFPCPH